MCAYDQCVRRRLGALAVSLTAVSVLAGCASGSVDKNLTDAKARDQIYSHLRRTLAALPEGTTFSLSSDSRRGPFDPGYTIVCSNSDGATPENTPVKVQIVYWVNGVPNGKQAGYITRITKLWKSWGWKEQPGDPTETVFTTPDGYTFGTTNAENGPGGVSLGAGSPCFWSKHDARVEPPLQNAQPHTFRQR